MSTTNDLIGRVRTRMALVAAVEDLQRAAAWSAGAALATLALIRFGVVVGPAWWAFVAGAAVAVAIPLAGLLVRRRDEAAVTAVTDERLGLRERLSTALWWRETQSADAAQFGPLVVADANAVAARVAPDAVARAFRPRLLRRPMIVAGALLAACGVASFFADRPGPIGETEAARVVRLADANRIAEVARKLRDAAKRVEDDAVERKEGELAKVAEEIRKKAEPLTRSPTPPREEALRQINAMADVARKQARQLAGLREPSDSKEAADVDRDLDELLENMSNVGLESLQRDLRALEERIKKGEKGQDRPSGDDVRDLAKRLDSLRKAMERAAAAAAAGDESILRKLRKFGNEELLAKVAQRLRELAARLDRGQNYDDLQSEAQQQEDDLSQMSEEELTKLLSELDQLSAMKDLEQMARQGGGEMSGGRKLRIDGVGRRSGDKSGKGGRGKGGKGETAGQEPGAGPGGDGQGSGKRPVDPNDPNAFQAENVKGKIDPKGRISVTSFRGLPKPGEVTVELREALQRARDDAQAPLDTEEIPRRYRDGIREYFDDLGRSK